MCFQELLSAFNQRNQDIQTKTSFQHHPTPHPSTAHSARRLGNETVVGRGVDVTVDGDELVEPGSALLDVGDEDAGGVDELGLANRSRRVDVRSPGLGDAIGAGEDGVSLWKIKKYVA